MQAYVRTSANSMEIQQQAIAPPLYHEDEVLLDVKAFGVGIHDRYFIPGGMGFGSHPEFPYVIGSEGSGIITKLGEKIKNFQIGDKVIFTTVLQEQGGSRAEHAVAKESALILLPDTLSFEQGAAIPIAGKTAIEALRALDLKAGETMFVAGASGAIGTLIIQLAKVQGVRVIASAGESNQEYMKKLGADYTVDYRDSERKQKVITWSDGGVDIALAIQPGTVQDSIEVVKDGGKVITVSGNDHVASERNIFVKQFDHGIDTQKDMEQLIEDIASGSIQLTLERVYPFDQALTALEKTETRHARGKIVVKVE